MNLAAFAHSEILAPFFLLVGIQLRAEVTHVKQIALPTFAALGGMVFPAAIFVSLNRGQEVLAGWPLVMPTDIALVMAVLLVLGKRVRLELKVFMLALAVADDLLSILVLGFKYADSLKPTEIFASLGCVALGALIPRMPLQSWLTAIVNFVIVPVYIFANVYPALSDNFSFSSRIGATIVVSRVVGKVLGIVIFAWLAVKLHIAKLPAGLRFGEIAGGAALAGMGLAVSFMIANISVTDEILLNQIRAGLLVTAVLSTIVGAVVLILVNRRIVEQ